MATKKSKVVARKSRSPKVSIVDLAGQVAAINRSQAVIEFTLDGKIVTANENFLKTLGYSLEEIKGQHHSMFVEESHRSSTEYRMFWEKLGRGEFEAGQYKRIGKGGKEVWIQASYNPIKDPKGKPLKVVKYATDITLDRLRTADFEGQLNAVNKSQAVIEFTLEGKIITANANFLSTLGYTPDEIKGQHHSMFVEPDVRASSEYRMFWEKLGRGEFDAGRYKRLGKGGREVWIQASYNPILDLNGKPFKVVKYATDVTEQVKLSEQIAQLVTKVKVAASEVTRGAEEISQGNANLSQRTEEQASCLEETASSMEQMTSTVKQNADNAGQANQLAVAARDQAEKGGIVVAKAVKAMTEINDASKKIADIIGVIDEIAFQTNLLALNAAVEAARAGEQGRGFAVVASEVRNLAGRSATAAKEIKELINDSSKKVDEGSSLVSQSGLTLEQLVSAVKKVSDIIAEIAAASQEQSSGIDQVNKAVMQLDEMTQQNAALVEQASAASESMADQARSLTELLANQESSHEEAAAPPPSAKAATGSTRAQAPATAASERRTVTRPWTSGEAKPAAIRPGAAKAPTAVARLSAGAAAATNGDWKEF